MLSPEYRVINATQHPDLLHAGDEIITAVWPEFMMHDPVANRFWNDLYSIFPEYQFALIDPATDQMVAVGNSLPLVWRDDPRHLPDAGWDWALDKGFADHAAGQQPTSLCALSISIAASHQGRGLSQIVVQTMKRIGQTQGLDALFAPVRPNLKSRYPLIPMERYITWQTGDGQPFDSWLRVHARLGAQIVKVCPQSMIITGSVKDWEGWANMRFPESGTYTVPGALVPIEIDCAADRGTYVEPNVWMRHELR